MCIECCYTNICPFSDPVFSDTCKIDNKFLSLNYLGGYVEPQASKGCVLSGPDKDQEVHIIELQAPNSSRYAAKGTKAKEYMFSQFIFEVEMLSLVCVELVLDRHQVGRG